MLTIVEGCMLARHDVVQFGYGSEDLDLKYGIARL